FPQAEVIYAGDFNVHHSEWLGSPHTDTGGREALAFAVTNDIEQIIKEPTRVPDSHHQTANILDLFFTTSPQQYCYSIASPLGKSDHCVISVNATFTPPTAIPCSKRRIWHWRGVQHENLSEFFCDFPWEEYCFSTEDPSLASERITEILVAGMEAYIPHNDKNHSSSNPWFNEKCSTAISKRNTAYRQFCDNHSQESHQAFIHARNQAKKTIRKSKDNFIKGKVNSLSESPSSSAFWSLAKNVSNNFSNSCIPPLFRQDGTIAASSIDKATVFAQQFSQNSTLDLQNVPLPQQYPLSNVMPNIIISYRKVLSVLSNLDVKKAYGPDKIPPRLLKDFARELTPELEALKCSTNSEEG
ncbi:hypothetical protein SNEBB_004946, partial [Seison nebaliae]